jgi:hypothetical protein
MSDNAVATWFQANTTFLAGHCLGRGMGRPTIMIGSHGNGNQRSYTLKTRLLKADEDAQFAGGLHGRLI